MQAMLMKLRFWQMTMLLVCLLVGVSGCAASPPVSMNSQASNSIPAAVADVPHIRRPSEQHFSSGQPSDVHLTEFAELGVQNVVNLRPPAEADGINEAAWVTEQGMAYYHIPIAGGADLTREHVATFHQIMQRIENEPTLLHCASGNRVGAMMALRAVWHQGMDVEQAIEIGKRYGLTSLEATVRDQLAN